MRARRSWLPACRNWVQGRAGPRGLRYVRVAAGRCDPRARKLVMRPLLRRWWTDRVEPSPGIGPACADEWWRLTRSSVDRCAVQPCRAPLSVTRQVVVRAVRRFENCRIACSVPAVRRDSLVMFELAAVWLHRACRNGSGSGAGTNPGRSVQGCNAGRFRFPARIGDGRLIG